MMQMPAPPDRIVGVQEVIERTGLSRATIHRYCKQPGKFPAPRQISAHRIGWLSSDIDAWLKVLGTPIAYRTPPSSLAAKS
jgi:prophage regulatory protein